MTDDEVREWVRGRLAYEAWLRALHARRDEAVPPPDEGALIAPHLVGATIRARLGRVPAMLGRWGRRTAAGDAPPAAPRGERAA